MAARGSGGEFAGMMRQRVRFDRRDPARDVLGGAAGAWEPVVTVWAAVTAERAGAAEAAGRVSAMPRYRVVMRERGDIGMDCRAVWRGQVFRLVSVEHDPASFDRMTLIMEQMP